MTTIKDAVMEYVDDETCLEFNEEKDEE